MASWKSGKSALPIIPKIDLLTTFKGTVTHKTLTSSQFRTNLALRCPILLITKGLGIQVSHGRTILLAQKARDQIPNK